MSFHPPNDLRISCRMAYLHRTYGFNQNFDERTERSEFTPPPFGQLHALVILIIIP
jgi:hypothetical protein